MSCRHLRQQRRLHDLRCQLPGLHLGLGLHELQRRLLEVQPGWHGHLRLELSAGLLQQQRHLYWLYVKLSVLHLQFSVFQVLGHPRPDDAVWRQGRRMLNLLSHWTVHDRSDCRPKWPNLRVLSSRLRLLQLFYYLHYLLAFDPEKDDLYWSVGRVRLGMPGRLLRRPEQHLHRLRGGLSELQPECSLRHLHADLLQGGWNWKRARRLCQVHQQLHLMHLHDHLLQLHDEDVQSRRHVRLARHLHYLPSWMPDLHHFLCLPVLRVGLQI